MRFRFYGTQNEKSGVVILSNYEWERTKPKRRRL